MTIAQALRKLDKFVKLGVPLSVEETDGVVTNVTYDKTWNTGGTEAIQTKKLDDNGNPVIEYKENYKEHTLAAPRISELDDLIEELLDSGATDGNESNSKKI